MSAGLDDVDRFSQGEDSLRGLAFELKHPLINIARQAELGDSETFLNIQQTAEQTLLLIDSYLLHARTEYGQIKLDLAPAKVGSVFHEVTSQLGLQAAQNNIELFHDDRSSAPVMTHRPALASILSAFASTLMVIGNSEKKEMILRGYKTRAGKIGVGVFTRTKLTQTDIEQALRLQGRALMPLSRLSSRPLVSLAIARGLCLSVGGEMTVKHIGNLIGLATELPRSEQLAFV